MSKVKKQKRSVIVKVSNDKFVKYDFVDNLVNFTRFLDRKFPGWRYMNVFDRSTNKQIANFTNSNRPKSHV